MLLIINNAEHFIIDKRVSGLLNSCDLNVNQELIIGISSGPAHVITKSISFYGH